MHYAIYEQLEAFQEEKVMAKNGELCWLKSVQSIIDHYKLTNLLKQHGQAPMKQTCDTVTFVIQMQYNALWDKKVKGRNPGEGKLRSYAKYKERIEYENYLDIIKNRDEQRNLTKLRISNHQLAIEKGRHKKIALENRLCPLGCVGEVEDEQHFLMNCAYLNK